MAKVKGVHDMFYFVDDVMQLLGFSRSKSYKIISELNKELAEQGKMVFDGRVSKRYFTGRLGLEAELQPRRRAV